MLNKIWQLAGGICSLFLFFIILMPQAEAKTFLAKDSQGNYFIEVKIAFNFTDDASARAADSLLKKWQAGMESIWIDQAINNEQIKFKFELIKVENGKTCADYPDYHCLDVVSTDYNQRGNVSDVSFNKPNSNKNSFGEWTIFTSPLDAAHEVGHLMGLLDDYHFEIKNGKRIWVNDNFQDSGVRSIMAMTWGEVAAPKDEISKILAWGDKLSTVSLALKP